MGSSVHSPNQLIVHLGNESDAQELLKEEKIMNVTENRSRRVSKEMKTTCRDRLKRKEKVNLAE